MIINKSARFSYSSGKKSGKNIYQAGAAHHIMQHFLLFRSGGDAPTNALAKKLRALAQLTFAFSRRKRSRELRHPT
jgi:hypothetical protein